MASPASSRFVLPASPVDPLDERLIGGDRQLFNEAIGPYAASLAGRSADILKDLADMLYAYYLADTLAYLARMLPPRKERRLRLGGRRGGADPSAPDLALAHSSPMQALQAWAREYSQTGGLLLMEARAIMRQIGVGAVLSAHGLIPPAGTIAGTRFPEELPSEEYIQRLIEIHAPPLKVQAAYYERDPRLVEREALLRRAFDECWTGFAIRFLRISAPDDALRVESVFVQEGAAVADTLLRMQIPIASYRKRRFEALAIFHELVAPRLAARPWEAAPR